MRIAKINEGYEYKLPYSTWVIILTRLEHSILAWKRYIDWKDEQRYTKEMLRGSH